MRYAFARKHETTLKPSRTLRLTGRPAQPLRRDPWPPRLLGSVMDTMNHMGLMFAAVMLPADVLPAQQFARPDRGRNVQVPGRPTVGVDRETLREEPQRSHG